MRIEEGGLERNPKRKKKPKEGHYQKPKKNIKKDIYKEKKSAAESPPSFFSSLLPVAAPS